MSRIDFFNDTIQDSLIKMAEGNPGAIIALLEIYKQTKDIDPDSVFGELSAVISLDAIGIYGPEIHMLYKDVCNYNVTCVLACLRAVQLGLLPPIRLKSAIHNYGKGINMQEIVNSVMETLPNFCKTNTETKVEQHD